MFARLQSYVAMPLLVIFELSGASINCVSIAKKWKKTCSFKIRSEVGFKVG